MTERKIRTKIEKFLKTDGWLVMPLSDQWVSGYPDLLCIKNGVHLFLEIKKPGGIVSKIQRYFMGQIFAHGGDAYVVYSVEEVKKLLEVLKI